MQRPVTSNSESHLLLYHVRTYLHVTNGNHICQKVAKKNKFHLFSLDVWLCLAMVIIILVKTIYSGNTTILYCLHHIIPSCIHCSTISSAKTSYFFFKTNLFFLFFCVILFCSFIQFHIIYACHIVSYYNINLFDKISSDGG